MVYVQKFLLVVLGVDRCVIVAYDMEALKGHLSDYYF